jgi:RNase P subunit RPR2
MNIPSMPLIFCKGCKETIYLNPKAYWNVNDVDVKCEKCNTINTITLENGELKRQV